MAAITLIALVGTPGTGCGYHLAGKNRFLPEDMRRIAVPLFGNLTPQAEIEQRITERLVEELARRGRYETPPDPAGADAVLEGAVTSYTTRPVEFTPRGKASRVEVTVQARVTLTDLRTKRVIWNQDQFVFRGEYDVPEDETTFINEEILAIDEIARDFSRTVVTSLLEGF